jgi:hypothetical protein
MESPIHAAMRGLTPLETVEPGDGATILSWTDRHAATVVTVSARCIEVREDESRLVSGNMMTEDQVYTYSYRPNAALLTFAPVRSGTQKGQWRENGRKDGRRILFGIRQTYRDPSF